VAEPWIPKDPPFAVTIDDQEGQVTHARADWWIPVLARADWMAIADSVEITPTLGYRLWDSRDAFDLDDAAQVAIRVTERVTGIPWPRAVRLAAQAYGAWAKFEAWATTHAHGLDPLTCPPRRVLAAVQAMLLGSCEKQQDVDRLMHQLDNPHQIPGITRAARTRAFVMDPADMAELSGPMTLGKAR
jgi:hypothetical protein